MQQSLGTFGIPLAQITNFKQEENVRTMLPISIISAMIGGAFAAKAEPILPDLKKQPTAQAVVDEHISALNKCDWNRLMAQYPDDAQINLPNGTIAKGRAAIGDLFAGLCKDPKDGGLNGIHFAAEDSQAIGETLVAQWVATAPFLAEPYKGSDAYITKDGLMQAMVSTFDGNALKMKK